MNRIRVLLADDHAVLRAGLVLLLNAQPDIMVVGEAIDGNEALEKVRSLKPDVLLLDITMPGLGGIEVIRALKDAGAKVAILVLTMHENETYLREALKAGALGYLPKKAAGAELVLAIKAVHRGDVYLYPSLARGIVEMALHVGIPDDGRPSHRLDQLSHRELEILRQIALGYTNRQIAGKLGLSVKTVESYKARVMEKLDLQSRVDLVRFALQHGLLSNGDHSGTSPSSGD